MLFRTRKKRDMNCKEPTVRVKDFEGQIMAELEKYAIPEHFKDWALEIIRGDNNSEIESRAKTYDMLNSTYVDLQRQLDNLTNLRIRDLIGDNEFISRKDVLQNEITKIRQKLSENQNRGQNWVEMVELAFNFATLAQRKFTEGSYQEKREILSALGLTYTLKDGKLTIDPIEWLFPISNLLKNQPIEITRLEPPVLCQRQTKNRALDPDFVKVGGYRESNPDDRHHKPM